VAEPRLGTLSTGGAEIVLREWGAKDARPLVFWHGESF
jgi:hypothetical protein